MKKASLYLFLAILFIGGIFTSCDNFLKAEELKNQIEAQIEYANAPSYTVTVNYDSEEGRLRKPAWGEISVKETDVFELKFDPAKNHSFARWEVTSKDIPAGQSIDDYISIENPNSPDTKATFKKALSSVVIKAVCPLLPYTEVSITGSNGKFSPSKGTYTCIDTMTYQLTFDPDSDYEFISWEIYDKNNEGFLGIIENGKYIKINDVHAADTTYSFVAEPEDEDISLAVRPILAERPQTTSCIPLYGVSNSIDSSINVIFDHDMDERSIYFTQDEINVLGKAGINNFLTDGSSTKCYGYKKVNGSSTTYYFKNISIIDEYGNNILANFGAPVFETPRILSIMPKSNNHIPQWTRITVTLDKSFFYEEEEKPITMAQSKKWDYMVTAETDSTSPSIGNIKVMSNNRTLTASQNAPSTYISNNKTFYIEMNVHDMESGPASNFTMRIYKASSSSISATKTFSFNDVTSQRATIKGEINFSDKTLEKDNYKMQIVVQDRKGNSTTIPAANSYYYFKIDKSPTPVPSVLFCVEKGTNSVKVAWLPPTDTNSESTEYNGYSIRWKTPADTPGNAISLGKSTWLYTIQNINPENGLIVELATKNGDTIGSYASFDVFGDPSPGLSFFIPIEDVFLISGRGTIATGKVAKGVININDPVQIIGFDQVFNSVCTGIEMFRKMVDSASTGDNVGILLRGISKDDICRGMYVVKPGEMQNYKKFKAFIHMNDSGNHGKPIVNTYRPQIYFGTTDITASQLTFEGTISPDEDRIIDIELIRSMPIYTGQRFDIREGGYNRGYGVVMEIIE